MSPDTVETPLTRPALVLIRDDRLREEVRRVAAAAQRPLVESEPPVGRHSWAGAPLVILDTTCAGECASAIQQRRTGVVLVTDGEPGLADWRAADGARVNRYGEQATMDFMTEIVGFMEATPWIRGYSWLASGTHGVGGPLTTTAFLDADGRASPMMSHYAALP